MPPHVGVGPRLRVLLLVRCAQGRQAQPLPQPDQDIVPLSPLEEEIFRSFDMLVQKREGVHNCSQTLKEPTPNNLSIRSLDMRELLIFLKSVVENFDRRKSNDA